MGKVKEGRNADEKRLEEKSTVIYWVPWLWGILDCFPRPEAESRMGGGVAGIRTGAHVGSQGIQAEDCSH